MKILKLTILFLCLSVNAYAQPFGGSFNPEGPSSTYQIFTNTNKFVGILDASDITVQQALEDLSFIVASPTTVISRWDFNDGEVGLPNYTTCPASCDDGDICYDNNQTSGQRIYACESGTWTLQGDGGAGGGDSVTVNSTAASDVQFNESLPSIPASGLGVKWQINTSTSPDSVSAYAAVSTSSVLAGVLSDETGSGGGVVFATSPTITSPTISTSIALPASAVDAITEIASALKSGADTTLVTGTAGGSGNCAQWNVDGDIVDSGAGCGGGSGDNILINGSAVTDANFNESNPSTPASGLSVKWQTTGSSATQITGYAAVSTSAILAGVLSDETGSSGGVVVFSSTPTIVTPTINAGVAVVSPPENDNDTSLATTAYVQTEIAGISDTNAVKEYWWPASASLPLEVADSIPPISKDAGTNIDQLTIDFDDSTDECRTVNFKVPSDVTSGSTITFRWHWYSAAATTNNAILEIRHNGGVAEGTDPDQALTVVAAAADATQGTAGMITATVWTETLANLGWAANEQVDAEFCRDANNASDTLVGDLKTTGFGIEIPRS